MHASLKELMERITNATRFTVLKSLDEDKKLLYDDIIVYDINNHDWFNDFSVNPVTD